MPQGEKLQKVTDIRDFFEKKSKEKTVLSPKSTVYKGGTTIMKIKVSDETKCRASYTAQPATSHRETAMKDVTDIMTFRASTTAQQTCSHDETKLSTGLRSMGGINSQLSDGTNNEKKTTTNHQPKPRFLS